jgi:hypothetical protein
MPVRAALPQSEASRPSVTRKKVRKAMDDPKYVQVKTEGTVKAALPQKRAAKSKPQKGIVRKAM